MGKKRKQEPVEHGIAEAVYSNRGTGYEPQLRCLCGFVAWEWTWEEAGMMLDNHLAEVATNE